MSSIPLKAYQWAIVLIALAIFLLAATLGGPGNARDVGAIHWLAAERASHHVLTSSAITLTAVGGAPGTIAILVAALAAVGFARRWRQAITIGLIVLGGRGVVEVIKLIVDRPRPHFGPWPVKVASLSFPSGHAANSMMTFLALALIAVPARFRAIAVTAAVLLSLLIGATRPYLGVHWPSDVVGGWAFGIAWVTALSLLVKQQHEVVGGHRPALD